MTPLTRTQLEIAHKLLGQALADWPRPSELSGIDGDHVAPLSRLYTLLDHAHTELGEILAVKGGKR